jgi:hypothetical protein
MFKVFLVIFVLALVGCSGAPRAPSTNCSAPTTYQCEIDMYMKAGG